MTIRHVPPTLLLSLALLAGCSDSNDDDVGLSADAAPPAVGDPASPPADDVTSPVDGLDDGVTELPADDAAPFDGDSGDDVFGLPAEDVPAYIERHERELEQVVMELDGTLYPLEFITFAPEIDAMVIGYPLGIALIGFDFETFTAVPELQLLETASTDDVSSFEELEAIATRRLVGSSIALEEDADGNLLYVGRVRDESTQGEFDVRVAINGALTAGGTSELSFDGETATLNGDLGVTTYIQLRDVIANRPEITRLVLDQVPGSLDDDINLHTGRLVRAAGLDTHLPATGDVSSGGVDLFVSGARRTVEEGGILAVHSGCCVDGQPYDQLPRTHPVHVPFIAYLDEMLGEAQGEAFHFFTIEAAPFEETRPMTREEMVRFGVVTE